MLCSWFLALAALAGGCLGPITAFRETAPVPHTGDAADDPAIWIHPEDPAQSTIIGTDKVGGLAVYDLHGRELEYRRGGRPNNVDLRYGFRLGGERVAIVATEERDYDQILLFAVDAETRRLRPVGAGRLDVGMEVYGSCMYRSAATGRFYVFVSSKAGVLRQFRLVRRRGGLDARLVRSFDVGDQTEACVADDAAGVLYVSEENRGIWRYAAEPGGGRERVLVDGTGRRGHLTEDVEGLTLAGDHLVASSQGEHAYAVYEQGAVDRYVRKFRIRDGEVDGVQDTDGIAATTVPLGPDFPHGLLVAQDGDNDRGNQNFKLVRWDLEAIVAGGG